MSTPKPWLEEFLENALSNYLSPANDLPRRFNYRLDESNLRVQPVQPTECVLTLSGVCPGSRLPTFADRVSYIDPETLFEVWSATVGTHCPSSLQASSFNILSHRTSVTHRTLALQHGLSS